MMLRCFIRLALLTTLCFTFHCRAKILRNNALINKMITHFQQDSSLSTEPRKKNVLPRGNEIPLVESPQSTKPATTTGNKKQEKILSLMQNVLCKNFPTVPCKMIVEDEALNSLIQRSIQQITHKRIRKEKSTIQPFLDTTAYPLVNSEDLSNFLEVSHTGYFNENINGTRRRKKKRGRVERRGPQWTSQEKAGKKKKKGKKETKHNSELYNGRKKLRKFYPHKVKYKDKNVVINAGNNQVEFMDYSDEKMSISVEMPNEGNMRIKPKSYKVEPGPVWRIDYMKHGIPSLNMFGYEDERLGKILKPAPGIPVDENTVNQQSSRKDVLHPDVYIKKNFVRKSVQTPEPVE